MNKLTASLKSNITFLNILIITVTLFVALIIVNEIVTGNIIGGIISLIILGGGCYYAFRK